MRDESGSLLNSRFLVIAALALWTNSACNSKSVEHPIRPDPTEMVDGSVVHAGPCKPGTVLIPGGNYDIGIDPEQFGLMVSSLPKGNYEAHPFCIDILELGHDEYQRCVADSKCHPRSVSTYGPCKPYFRGVDMAENCLSYYDLAEYCETVGGRVPTEVEWEVAARGHSGYQFPWGDDRAPLDEMKELGPQSRGRVPKDRSPFGVMDLAGGVVEWTSSSVGTISPDLKSYYLWNYKFQSKGQWNWTRGMSYGHAPPEWSLSMRYPSPMDERSSPFMGGRCVYPPKE